LGGLFLPLLLLIGCRTTAIGDPLTTPLPSNLSLEDAEVAIVAMLTAGSHRQVDPATLETLAANPLAAAMLDWYRHDRSLEGWFLEAWEPGRVRVGYQRRMHQLRVVVDTSVDPISIRIEESRELMQSENRIHARAKV
jgi:hypothetical protein